MKTQTRLLLAALGLVLLACGNSDEKKNFSPVKDVIQRLLLAQQAGLKPTAPGPYLSMIRRATGVVTTLTPLDVDGSVVTWRSNSGAQLVTRDGVLIATRGFGADLMSADAPDVATLVRGTAGYGRSYHLLDGNDTPVRLVYSCTAAAGSGPAVAGATRHIVESCEGDAGRIKNDYWISSAGQVVKSQQFVSESAGYFEISVLKN